MAQPAQPSAPPRSEPALTPALIVKLFPCLKTVYRIRSLGVLLTFLNFSGLLEWAAFCAWVLNSLKRWKAKLWCATMETCKDGKFHVHLMLQFFSAHERVVTPFWYKGMKPNASSHDLCGEGMSGRKLQQSLNRGFFYVWASKIGTVKDSSGKDCTAGNYWPAWCEEPVTYQVLGKWPEALWKKYKLTHDVYEDLLFKTRDVVQARKRNLDACREHQEAKVAKEAVEARVRRIRGNPELYRAFPDVPEATAWLKLFAQDALRYPFLVVLAPSQAGKTEWASSLFKNPLEAKVGDFEHFPDKLRQFKRGWHDGLILDDLRDLRWLVKHQDKLQGKYNDHLEFGSTPGGTCAYTLDLFAVPVVVTANYSTRNLQLLETDDFLSNPRNRVLVHFKGLAGASEQPQQSEQLVFL